ncbi:MAG: hypothetical protein RSF35_00035 [Akkermansia sp.]
MSLNKEKYDAVPLERPKNKMAALDEVIAHEDAERKAMEKYAPKSDVPELIESTEETILESKDQKEDNLETKIEGKSEKETLPQDAPQESNPVDKKEDAIIDDIQKDGENDHKGADDGETSEPTEGDASSHPHQTSPLIWNIVILIIILIISGMAYMYWKQMQDMPMTPLQKAEIEYNELKTRYNKEKLEFFEVEKRKIRNQTIVQKRAQADELEKNVDLKNKEIENLEREIMGIRGEIRSWFTQYRDNTRRKARNLHFDDIVTVKTGKTYLDATIQRVTDQYISIVHAGGAIRISPSDLPEALRERLAFSDPLGIQQMDEEVQQEQQRKAALGKYLPVTYRELGTVESQQGSVSAPAPALGTSPAQTPKQDQGDSSMQPLPAPPSLSAQAQQKRRAAKATPVSTPIPAPAAKPAPVPANVPGNDDFDPPSQMPQVDTAEPQLPDDMAPIDPMPATN